MTARFKKRRSIFQEVLFLAFTVLNNSKLSHKLSYWTFVKPSSALLLTQPISLAAIFKHYTRRHAYARMTACGLCRVCGMYCGNSYLQWSPRMPRRGKRMPPEWTGFDLASRQRTLETERGAMARWPARKREDSNAVVWLPPTGRKPTPSRWAASGRQSYHWKKENEESWISKPSSC